MIKKLVSVKRNSEKGIALIMILGFLAIGGLTISTLLNLIDTGVNTARQYEEKIKLQYAADAGMEEALWRMQNEELPFQPESYGESANYTVSHNINGKDISINITYIRPLVGLESDIYGTEDPDSLTITGGIINREEGKYKVQVSYDGSQGDMPIDKIAVWLPSRFDYVADSSEGLTEDNPAVSYARGGKIFTWTFDPAVNFLDLPNPAEGGGGFLPGAEYPAARKLYFNLTPTDDIAGGSFSWVRTTDTTARARVTFMSVVAARNIGART